MYQTGGLFHPLLSQRIYQSNQGLKLSAKAFWLPKGTFICLKSRGLPSDRRLICNGRGSVSSLEVPTGRCPPDSCQRPHHFSSPCLSPTALVRPPFSNVTIFTSGFRLTGPTEYHNPSCLSQSTNPHWGQGALMVTAGLLLSLLFSDSLSCSAVMAISTARFPGQGLGYTRELERSLVGQEGLNWGSCSDICYVLLLRRGFG